MNRATSPTGWARNPDGSPGYTWNPITGCLNNCEYCYARKLANGRLKPLYLANRNVSPITDGVNDLAYSLRYATPFYPRFWEERLSVKELGNPFDPSYSRMKPKGVFVCDMGDLFGNCIPETWQANIFTTIASHPYDRFYLLTKQPQNLIKFSPFPENCWVGVTATNQELLIDGLDALHRIEAKVKYISFEPLLEAMNGGECEGKRLDGIAEDIDWLIIGACTGTKLEMQRLVAKYPQTWLMPYGNKWTRQPDIEWVREIVEAADKAGVKVFLKDNLIPLLSYSPDKSKAIWAYSDMGLRQELP